MVADYFTKPLQGHLFVKFRDIVMGIKHFSTLDVPVPNELQSVLREAKYVPSRGSSVGTDPDTKIPLTGNNVTWATVVRRGAHKSLKKK